MFPVESELTRTIEVPWARFPVRLHRKWNPPAQTGTYFIHDEFGQRPVIEEFVTRIGKLHRKGKNVLESGIGVGFFFFLFFFICTNLEQPQGFALISGNRGVPSSSRVSGISSTDENSVRISERFSIESRQPKRVCSGMFSRAKYFIHVYVRAE